MTIPWFPTQEEFPSAFAWANALTSEPHHRDCNRNSGGLCDCFHQRSEYEAARIIVRIEQLAQDIAIEHRLGLDEAMVLLRGYTNPECPRCGGETTESELTYSGCAECQREAEECE